jgi:hypothetical protein
MGIGKQGTSAVDLVIASTQANTMGAGLLPKQAVMISLSRQARATSIIRIQIPMSTLSMAVMSASAATPTQPPPLM